MAGKLGLNINDEKTEYTMISFSRVENVKEENVEGYITFVLTPR